MDFSHFKVFYGLEVEEFNNNTFTLPTHTGDLQNQVSWGNFLKSDILMDFTYGFLSFQGILWFRGRGIQ